MAARANSVHDGVVQRSDFERIYRRYFHPCCCWLVAMGVPDLEVEDLAQEVFLVVRRRLAEDPVESPGAWIYQIAWRVFSRHRRRSWWRRIWRNRSELGLDEPAREPGPLELLENRERAQKVQALLDKLPPRQRVALVLFESVGYSGEEIAELEGIPVATVWTRLHHARKQLLRLCADDPELGAVLRPGGRR